MARFVSKSSVTLDNKKSFHFLVFGYLKLNKPPIIFNGKILNVAFNQVRYKNYSN